MGFAGLWNCGLHGVDGQHANCTGMLSNFEKYWVKIKKRKRKKLQTFCELKWPALMIGWPVEGTLSLQIANGV